MGSNPAKGMDVRPLCLLCVVSVATSATADDLSPTRYVCLLVACDLENSTMNPPRPDLVR